MSFYRFLSGYIHIPIFIASFVIGFLFMMYMGDEKKIIYVYPTPENVNKILFQDEAKNCFQYNTIETSCPNDETKITKIPIQTI
jgi:hypothetical protein